MEMPKCVLCRRKLASKSSYIWIRGPSSESSLYGETVFHLLDGILVSFTYAKTLLHSMAITDIHGASW